MKYADKIVIIEEYHCDEYVGLGLCGAFRPEMTPGEEQALIDGLIKAWHVRQAELKTMTRH